MMRTRSGGLVRLGFVAVVCLACLAVANAVDAPSSKPKQSVGNYVKLFLKPSKEEKDVDAYALVIPGKIAWALKTTTYFGLWYFFNIFYNIANKKSLNALDMPWMQSLVCVAVGIPYSLALWALRIQDMPRLTGSQISSMIPIFSMHAAGNVGGNVAFGAGALGFAHVLKSMEPAFTALFEGLLKGKWKHPMEYATLIPVMGGVAYASASEVQFSMLQFVSAMVSNVGFSLRSVLSKGVMNGMDRKVTKMDGPNTFRTLQIGASLITVPFVAMVEGWRGIVPWLHPNWKAAIGKQDHAGAMITPGYLYWQLLMSGLAFQLYNEAAFLALDAVSPTTYSIGNNVKRIVIVVTSVIIFGTKMSTQSVIGSSIAMAGVFTYSMVSDYFGALAKKAASA